MERLSLEDKYSAIELSIHAVRYLPAKQHVTNKKVLDIACGEGYGTKLLKMWGASEVIGVDKSAQAIQNAQKHHSVEDNIKFICDDAINFLNGQTKYDVIISIETFEHINDAERFISKIKNSTHEKSTIIISCPNDYYYYGRGKSVNKHHIKGYSFYDFRTLSEKYLGSANWYLGSIANGFAISKLEEYHDLPNDYVESLKHIDNAESLHISNSEHIPNIIPSRSLFYYGIWSTQYINTKSYSSLFPTEACYRIPQIRNVASDVAIGVERKCAFVIDVKNWAFDNIVSNIEGSLEGRYKIEKFYAGEYEDNLELLYDLFIKNKFDNIHFMWRELYFNLISNQNLLRKLRSKSSLNAKQLGKCFSHPIITTSIYDHMFLDEESILERKDIWHLVDGYATSSNKLMDIYRKTYDVSPVCVTPDGVNLDQFKPKASDQETDNNINKTYMIGWVGNSTWGTWDSTKKHLGEDPKGLNTIVIPAVKILEKQGYNIQLHIADRNVRHRNKTEMLEYYHEIDVLLCSSSVEGTPNPILEAMACGLPFISTDVGIVSDVSGPKQKRYILKDRSPEAFANALKHMLFETCILKDISKENSHHIQKWTWENHIPKWLHLFSQASNMHELNKGITRALTVQMSLENSISTPGNSEKIKNLENKINELEKQKKEANIKAKNLQDKLKSIKNKKLSKRIKRTLEGLKIIRRKE